METQSLARRPFQDAVAYYERFRLVYPQRLIARVAGLLTLAPGDAVLDLGCGTGFLAVAFARAGMDVTAADPEPLMLEAAAAAAREAGVTLRFWQGGSSDLTASMGPYRLVTMGRAFHWMDRAATLAMLDRIVAPEGAVALFHDRHPDVEENRWFKVLGDVSERYRRRAGVPRGEGAHRRYEPYLLASAFREIDSLGVTIRRDLTADEIVGRAFSQSFVPEGEARGAFEHDLRDGLRALSPDGSFVEIAELVAVVARRSIAGDGSSA
jgi:ubiquinone/menaquinone biosynthesis C-methylase UbiE